MNKYLEKVASWKNPSKFVGYLTGSTKREAGAKVRHMEEAVANKLSLEDLKKGHSHASEQTTKARIAASGAGLAAAGGTAFGYKKIRDKQRNETIAQYNALFKEGSAIQAAGTAVKATGSALWKHIKNVGSTTADMMNTAGGGKVKDFATRQGYKPGNKDYKEFVHGDVHGQVKSILKKKNVTKKNTGGKVFKETRHQHTQEIGNLHRNRRDARIALGAAGAAGVSAYGWKKARDAQRKNNPYY